MGHQGSLNIAESALLVKTDANGNMQWDKFYGGSGGAYFLSIVEVNEGGFAITGGIGQQRLLFKTDYDGNIQWNKTYGEAHCLIRTKDGGYMLAQSGGSLTKTDSLGELQWTASYGGDSVRKLFFSVVQTRDDGFVAVGMTYPVYDGVAWVVKTNVSGDLLGEVLIEPVEGINNRASSIVEADDGGYVFTGSKDAPPGNVWIVKIDQAYIPEFPSWILLPLLIVAPLVVIVIRTKIRKKGLE